MGEGAAVGACGAPVRRAAGSLRRADAGLADAIRPRASGGGCGITGVGALARARRCLACRAAERAADFLRLDQVRAPLRVRALVADGACVPLNSPNCPRKCSTTPTTRSFQWTSGCRRGALPAVPVWRVADMRGWPQVGSATCRSPVFLDGKWSWRHARAVGYGALRGSRGGCVRRVASPSRAGTTLRRGASRFSLRTAARESSRSGSMSCSTRRMVRSWLAAPRARC